MKKKQTLYSDFTNYSKQDIRKVLDAMDKDLVDMLSLFDKNIIASIKEEQELIKKFKANQLSLEQFVARAKKLTKYRKDFLFTESNLNHRNGDPSPRMKAGVKK